MKLVECIRADLLAEGRSGGLAAFAKAFLFSPGFKTVFICRLARWFCAMGRLGRVTSRLLWLHNVRRSGCHISPLANIGSGLYLPHSTGIVIGEGAVIGNGVTIYQNVTVGVGRSVCGRSGYPTIGDQATIYSNAVVFGAIIVGNRARVGAGEVLNRSIDDEATVKAGIIAHR